MKMYNLIFSLLSAVTVVSALGGSCKNGVCICGFGTKDSEYDWAPAITDHNDGVNAETADKRVCEPGHTKREENYNCTCISDGSGYACMDSRSIDEVNCEPGTNFVEYCNSCRCGNDGLRENAACTRRECQPGMWNRDGTMVNVKQLIGDVNIRRKRQEADNTESCNPGSTKMMDCNSCRCMGNPPRWACTLMLCYHDEVNHPTL